MILVIKNKTQKDVCDKKNVRDKKYDGQYHYLYNTEEIRAKGNSNQTNKEKGPRDVSMGFQYNLVGEL